MTMTDEAELWRRRAERWKRVAKRERDRGDDGWGIVRRVAWVIGYNPDTVTEDQVVARIAAARDYTWGNWFVAEPGDVAVPPLPLVACDCASKAPTYPVYRAEYHVPPCPLASVHNA